jgi:hypothetical protein
VDIPLGDTSRQTGQNLPFNYLEWLTSLELDPDSGND